MSDGVGAGQAMPLKAARATACPRCGAFAALSDDGWGPKCERCQQATWLKLAAPAGGAGALVGKTLSLWRESFWIMTFASLGASVPEALLSLVKDAPFWAELAVSIVLSSWFEALALSLAVDKALLGRPRLDRAIARVNLLYTPLLLVNIATNLFTFLGLIACVVGFFFAAALMIQAVPLALFEDHRPHRAIAESFRRGRPHLIPLALASVIFAGVTAVAIGAELVWAAALEEMPRKAAAADGRLHLILIIEPLMVVAAGILMGGSHLFQVVAWRTFKPAPLSSPEVARATASE